jgi:DNA-binding SARP family transcriptional activator
MLQVLVSRLRAALEDAGLVDAHQSLQTRAPGYVLVVAPGQLDLADFIALVDAGRAVRSTDLEFSSARLHEALALWRGEPLSDVADEPFAADAIRRLKELRLTVTQERIDLDLALGRHATVVAELRDLTRNDPLSERLVAQLMLALYRCGRQAEALETYRRTRATLVEELGIEPGPELQRLERAVLQQAPELELERPADAAAAAPPVDQPPQPSRARRRRRLVAAIAVAAIVATAAILLGTVGRRRSGTAVHAAANSVAAIDPRTLALVADVPVGNVPGPVAVAAGAVWVGTLGDRTIQRIDLKSRTIVKTFGLPAAPTSVTSSGDLVWVGDGFAGTLSRIIPAYDAISAPFYPAEAIKGLLAVAATPGALWVGLPDDRVVELDADSLQLRTTIRLSRRPLVMAASDSAAWIVPFEGSLVIAAAPQKATPVTELALSSPPHAIATGSGSVWVGTSGVDRIWQIDPRSATVTGSVDVGVKPDAIAVGYGAVWVAGGPTGTVVRIDPATLAVTGRIVVGRELAGLALGGRSVWVTVS